MSIIFSNTPFLYPFLKINTSLPHSPEVYYSLGLIYQAEDKEQAVSMYKKALSIEPSFVESANNLGLLLIELNRSNEAIPLFQQVIATYRDNPLPQNNLGMAYFNLEQLTEAATCFKKALSIDPSDAPGFAGVTIKVTL